MLPLLRQLYTRYDLQPIRMLRNEILMSCETMLDLGCGNGNHMTELAPHLRYSVGIDICYESIASVRKRPIYSDALVMDAREISRVFPPRSFDCVVAFDLIEHLEKADGHSVLDAMESVASKKVIVFTPNKFLPQGAIYGNRYQIHRSGWSVAELKSKGFTVTGVHGIKYLLGEQSIPKWKPYRFWLALSLLTQPLCVKVPTIAFQLFCAKRVDG